MIEQLRATVEQKDEKIQTLEHQLHWFKRQLFSEKSEKRDMTDNPYQHTIADLMKELPKVPDSTEEEKQTISYQRDKAKKNSLKDTPDDSGLRLSVGSMNTKPICAISLSGEKKRSYRTENRLPVVDAFFGWCYQQH